MNAKFLVLFLIIISVNSFAIEKKKEMTKVFSENKEDNFILDFSFGNSNGKIYFGEYPTDFDFQNYNFNFLSLKEGYHYKFSYLNSTNTESVHVNDYSVGIGLNKKVTQDLKLETNILFGLSVYTEKSTMQDFSTIGSSVSGEVSARYKFLDKFNMVLTYKLLNQSFSKGNRFEGSDPRTDIILNSSLILLGIGLDL